ncbi:MAG: hypothetical protein A2W61_07495 [Deltaproteobacteria bacterium RIFCSPLOWO2_01_44_7]|nr:MAG: hypothetical protein A2712_08615 [Deltaproteobacteria bacterium RIFCSPHIGHO2_01_FULL_43_49]OGQ14600.1 MAG: hypothetical protein A3D22_08385 [Deltaproteobacteria bacterium RIFCSPHIGHO2_02_FULL_44_53]OGQ27986.1 MAG: hypothetical protein A3D98_07095 [Deltaproteobacteria bacterium RIFCSPHIGHO2_12_FULL_44_21]OGQ31198.1 MAG: hypothetical protein A2979_07145 [Deltaproteobacteria bacterium RIFCSPLOWO2_01_FULL_45_74]OGQ37974.1 MAG: hypothetical protein A2W61_07495 [Deltaproteobacteria bacterium 
MPKNSSIIQIEANIDDMNPQIFDYVMERLFKAGCVDVALQPIQMKKNRPGVLLKVLCPKKKQDKAIEIILRETTTLGVRYFPVKRKILTRQLKIKRTRFGSVPIKIAFDKKLGIQKWIPEYEACRKIARRKKIPIRLVYEEALEKSKIKDQKSKWK